MITVREASSRSVLSRATVQSQELACVLIVHYAIIEQFGPPHALITDNVSQYTVKYQPHKTQIKDVLTARRFTTPFDSPQSKLWELDTTQWKLATQLPQYDPRKHRKRSVFVQTTLPEKTHEA